MRKNKLSKVLLSLSILPVATVVATVAGGGVLKDNKLTQVNNISRSNEIIENNKASRAGISFNYNNSNYTGEFSKYTAKDAKTNINSNSGDGLGNFKEWLKQFLSDSRFVIARIESTDYKQETGEVYISKLNIYRSEYSGGFWQVHDQQDITPNVWIRGFIKPRDTRVEYNNASPYSVFTTTPVTLIEENDAKLIKFVNDNCLTNIGVNGNVVSKIKISDRSDTEGWIKISEITINQYRDEYYNLVNSSKKFTTNIKIAGFYKGTYIKYNDVALHSDLGKLYASDMNKDNNVFVEFIKNNSFKVLPSGASPSNNYYISKINTAPNNDKGELIINSIELSSYIDENGNTISGYKVFAPVTEFKLKGFKTGSLETIANSSIPPVDGSLSNLVPYQITESAEIKQYLIDNVLTNLPQNFSVNNIIGISFGNRDNRNGTIDIQSITINKYLDVNGKVISGSKTIYGPWNIKGFSIDTSKPNDFVPGQEENRSPASQNDKWKWILILAGASMLFILIIVVAIIISISRHRRRKTNIIKIKSNTPLINSPAQMGKLPHSNRLDAIDNGAFDQRLINDNQQFIQAPISNNQPNGSKQMPNNQWHGRQANLSSKNNNTRNMR